MRTSSTPNEWNWEENKNFFNIMHHNGAKFRKYIFQTFLSWNQDTGRRKYFCNSGHDDICHGDIVQATFFLMSFVHIRNIYWPDFDKKFTIITTTTTTTLMGFDTIKMNLVIIILGQTTKKHICIKRAKLCVFYSFSFWWGLEVIYNSDIFKPYFS